MRHAMSASTAIGDHAAHEDGLRRVGTPSPKYLTHAARHDSSTTDESFSNTPRTGR